MKKIILFGFLVAIVLSACSSGAQPAQEADTGLTVTVFYSPT